MFQLNIVFPISKKKVLQDESLYRVGYTISQF